jgi:cold shock CspA family protein/ribosome-associated translation inhibitor RaiA
VEGRLRRRNEPTFALFDPAHGVVTPFEFRSRNWIGRAVSNGNEAMQIPLKIAFEGGLTATDALRERIEREAGKLEQFAGRITACRVAVIGRSGRHQQGGLYQVRIHIIVVDRNPEADHAHEDAYVAVRDAFNAARRRLQDHERRSAGQIKIHEVPPHGRVARLIPEQDYGFIEASDGREIYFHRNAVMNDSFDKLKPGAEVRFAESEGDKGPQASTVHLIGRSHIVAPI